MDQKELGDNTIFPLPGRGIVPQERHPTHFQIINRLSLVLHTENLPYSLRVVFKLSDLNSCLWLQLLTCTRRFDHMQDGLNAYPGIC